MAFNRYYEDELAYLRDLGDLFAHENPTLAGFLAREASDPDVERLLEGFAFLTARLRQKLDDELPEAVHGLMEIVWPHYLRPVPPVTILAFDQLGGGGPAPIRVPRGTQVRSRPVDGTSCAFATSYHVDVMPLTVEAAEIDNRSTSSRLVIEMRTTPRGSLRALQGGRLRLHFSTERDPLVGRVLYLWMLRYATSVRATTETGESVELGSSACKPVGFADDEAVLPAPVTAFSAFRLLQEYLAFPAKFLFVDLEGLEPLAASAGSRLTLSFEFRRPMPAQARVSAAQIRLNATPAVNLFEAEAQPISVSAAKTEYRVVAAGAPAVGIHAVEAAVGHVQGRGERVPIHPFHSFRHDGAFGGDGRLYFKVRVRPAVVGNSIDHYVSFVDGSDRIAAPQVEVVSLRLAASNGRLAQRLAVGHVDQAGWDTPSTVSFTNIASVMGEVPPPIEDALLWRLISNLARNFRTIVGREQLCALIASYDFRALHDAQARRRLELLLAGIEDFTDQPGDAIVRGAPVRLRRLVLTVAESRLGGEAEMFLFGTVLDAFLAAYAGINSLHRFTIRGSEENASYDFAMRRGLGSVV